MNEIFRNVAVAVLALVLSAGCVSPSEPSTGGQNPDSGDGLTLPPDAPPHAREAYEKAERTEKKRDELEQEALAEIKQHVLPEEPDPTTGDVEPDPCDQDSAEVDADPTCSPPTEEPEPVVVVPPEVKAAIDEWIEAQRAAIRECKAASIVIDDDPNDGIGTSRNPICGRHPVPPEFVPWIKLLGYDVEALIQNGV